MTLNYLDFDYSESEHGAGTFDALASCSSAQLPALHAELRLVLAWVHDTFPGQRGDIDQDGEWDYALSSQREWSAADHLDYDEGTQSLTERAQAPAPPRHTVSLCLSGRSAFCEAFRKRLGL